MSAPDGVNAASITTWLADRAEAVSTPLSFTPVHGGRSNLTFVVSDADERRWVLRRPPLHSVLPSAHDMGRESTVITALADTAVPVPPVIGYETDESVTGAPFYVMEYIEGTVVRDATAAEALPMGTRRHAGESLVDTLAALHAVDPDDVGLGEFGRREGYVARQLRRWHTQLQKGREYGARELPVLDRTHDRLAAAVPEQGPASIVHGDYRLDNVIISPAGDVLAVLDWELSTLGDPLADVGYMVARWPDPGDPIEPAFAGPTIVEGFPKRAEAVDRYADASGRNLENLDYYVSFGYWKLAVIVEGVYARFASGAYGNSADDTWKQLGDVVLWLTDQAAATAP